MWNIVDNSIQRYRGLSTDTKPAAAPGAEFLEMDTGKAFLYDADGESWTEQPASGGGGSVGVPENDVNFIDYDGTIVASYSAADFADLTDLPANPSHAGLTAQGWNWKLSDAKTYVASYGRLIIGQMYITDDEKTRLYIHIDKEAKAFQLDLGVAFKSSVADNTTIDWGDGTVETKGSTSKKTYEHTYSAPGDYVITLKVNSGSIEFGGSSANIFGNANNTTTYRCNYLRKVEIGSGVSTIGTYTFQKFYSLSSITIPKSVTSLGTYFAYYCYGLKSITIPTSVTEIPTNSFQYDNSLTSIAIPKEVTSIGASAFASANRLTLVTFPPGVTSIEGSAVSSCYALRSFVIPSNVTTIKSNALNTCLGIMYLTIPASVTSLEASAFASCSSIAEYHFLPTSPPALANTNVFNGIQSYCKIYVPKSTGSTVLAAYKAAQYWSTYASYIEEEPE